EIRGLYPQQNVMEGLRKLKEQINAVRPSVIIGLGNYSLWGLTDNCFSIGDEGGYKVPSGVGQWRGSMLRTSGDYGRIPFLPTYHPAAALRTHSWRYMIKHDLSTRIPKALNGDWDEPPYDFQIQPSFERATNYLLHALSLLDAGELEMFLDLETSRNKRLISCVGLSIERTSALSIPLMCSYREDGYLTELEEYEIVQLLRRVLSHPNLRLIGHNLLFDVQYILDQLWVRPRIYFDTMIAH